MLPASSEEGSKGGRRNIITNEEYLVVFIGMCHNLDTIAVSFPLKDLHRWPECAKTLGAIVKNVPDKLYGDDVVELLKDRDLLKKNAERLSKEKPKLVLATQQNVQQNQRGRGGPRGRGRFRGRGRML